MDRIARGHVPSAFSNPIYVDVDGDGRFTPPGLPPRAPDRPVHRWLWTAFVLFVFVGGGGGAVVNAVPRSAP